MPWTENQEGASQFTLQMTQDEPKEEKADTARSFWEAPVPYTEAGIIDWGLLEDSIPIAESDEEFQVEVASLDFSKPQPSNLHPYYHAREDLDCIMVSHKCNCPLCRQIEVVPSQMIEDVASPARKRMSLPELKQPLSPSVIARLRQHRHWQISSSPHLIWAQ